ncbi:MAG: bifunctional metallophosphatase/5'-nucleotidase [Gammaproteobacteria bacterium]|nr:bifunctional metallophosphatase/5'-nucleotidase [Gammaproteobacteria bacterium]
MRGVLLLFSFVFVLFSTPLVAEILTILHTSDLHARIEPINQHNNTCTEKEISEQICFGGYARLATAIQTERDKSKHTILVDAGDQFQGSLFFTYYQGQALVELMNMVRYDGMTTGNHEFVLGPEGLNRFIQQTKFPVLLSNADISEEPLLNDILKPSTIVEREGYKYGLIGLSPMNTEELSSPGPNVKFTNPVMALSREITKLTSQGVNRIIVLSHLGFGMDKYIAASVDGIDVIVGGHSNTLLSNHDDTLSAGPYPTWVNSPNGVPVAIVHAYAYGKYLGRLDISFDDQGKLTSATGDPILLDYKIKQNQEVQEIIEKLDKPLNEIRSFVISKATRPINGSRINCRNRDCETGNLVADAILSHMKSKGADIAIINSGGLRSSIDQGDITMAEVLAMLPFDNKLSSFELTGADILATLESGVAGVKWESGRFPQVSGIRFRYSFSSENGSPSVYDVEVNKEYHWVPIDLDEIYGVVTNDFLRSGGDGYSAFFQNARNANDYGPAISDIVADYLKRMDPYEPVLDGRIIHK